ncbi:MAG TPA: hypothetical protein VF635_12640, partial [Propionibacteriaceae bacterium]
MTSLAVSPPRVAPGRPEQLAGPAPASAPVEPPVPMRWAHSTVEEIVQAARDHQRSVAEARGSAPYKEPVWGARIILTYLATLPGESWNDRWLLLDARTAQGGDWREIIRPGSTPKMRQTMMAGLGVLLMMDVIRPTYAWQQDASIFVYRQLSEQRDVDSTRIVLAKI